MAPLTHSSFQPRSSTLQNNFFCLPYIIDKAILQVRYLFLCPPNTPFLFSRVKFKPLRKEGPKQISGVVSSNSVLLVLETSKHALFKKDLTKRAHELSASSNSVLKLQRKVFICLLQITLRLQNLPTWLSAITGTGSFHLLGNSQNRTAGF